MVEPVDRKRVVEYVVSTYSISVRKACRLASVSRTGFAYKPPPLKMGKLKNRLVELATQYTLYGYLMLHSLLKTEGLVVNKKHTYRLYTERKLQVRTKIRKKLTRERQPMCSPI